MPKDNTPKKPNTPSKPSKKPKKDTPKPKSKETKKAIFKASLPKTGEAKHNFLLLLGLLIIGSLSFYLIQYKKN